MLAVITVIKGVLVRFKEHHANKRLGKNSDQVCIFVIYIITK